MPKLEIVGDEVYFGDYLVAEIIIKENNRVRADFVELLENTVYLEDLTDDN